MKQWFGLGINNFHFAVVRFPRYSSLLRINERGFVYLHYFNTVLLIGEIRATRTIDSVILISFSCIKNHDNNIIICKLSMGTDGLSPFTAAVYKILSWNARIQWIMQFRSVHIIVCAILTYYQGTYNLYYCYCDHREIFYNASIATRFMVR